jgi:hypothetical protein
MNNTLDITLSYGTETLNYTVIDSDICNFIKQSSNPLEQLQILISNGYLLTKVTESRPSASCHGLQELKDSILPITELFNTGGNSSKNGKLCEVLMGDLFKKSFPSIQYTDTAGTDRNGDAVITIEELEIMVDYKNYDKPVPSAEIDKLVRDLKIHNIPMGILYSTKSKITKKDIIDYDIIDGKLIVFLSGEGISSNSLILAVKFLIHLHKTNIVTLSDKVCNLVNKTMAHKLQSMYMKLIELRELLQRQNEKIDDTSEKMLRLLSSLKEDGVHMLSNVVSIVDEINEVIQDTHRDTYVSTPHNELIDFVNRSTDKKKDITQCLQLLNLTDELNIKCGISELNHIALFKNETEIGKLKITKSNAVLVMYNLVKGPSMFDSEYEQIKNGNFHINLIDSHNVWNIIRGRFQ